MRLQTFAPLTALTFAAACAAVMEAESVAPGIDAGAQEAGASVTVASASIAADGWLVIHAMKDGKPVAPASIGHAPLKAGVNADVVVALDQPTQPGETVLAMLHQDTGERGVYEFGPGAVDEDKPVVVDGKPVVLPLRVE